MNEFLMNPVSTVFVVVSLAGIACLIAVCAYFHHWHTWKYSTIHEAWGNDYRICTGCGLDQKLTGSYRGLIDQHHWLERKADGTFKEFWHDED